MKVEGVIYCEGPGCEVHQRVGVPNMNAGRLPVGWVRFVEYGDVGPEELGFHGYDCAMKWLAQFPPPEDVEQP